jgi:peptidyl-prolyl cis-trans isomerase SurA
MLRSADSRPVSAHDEGETDVTARLGPAAAHLAALLAFTLGVWGSQPPEAAAQAKQQGIVVVVNDEAITAYDIDQRARFLGLGGNVNDKAKEVFERIVKDQSAMQALQEEVVRANQGKSRDEIVAIIRERLRERAFESARAAVLPKLRKDAKEQLIEDRLKLQDAKKHGIEASDEEVKRMLVGLAEKNKMTYEQFAKHLKGLGVEISAMGEKFRAEKVWRDLIGRRFGPQVSVSQRDIDEALSDASIAVGEDMVELQLQKISLPLSGRTDQTAWTRRYADAEAMQRRFAGCKSMGELAKSAPDTRFEDMKYVKPGSIAEPMRSLLLSAKDDAVLPPVTTAGGVDLYAVCGRRTSPGDDAKRTRAMQVLQAQKLERLALRHLRNLRQEANIEHK